MCPRDTQDVAVTPLPLPSSVTSGGTMSCHQRAPVRRWGAPHGPVLSFPAPCTSPEGTGRIWSCSKPHFSQSSPTVTFLRISRTLWDWGRSRWVQVAVLDLRKSRILLIILNIPKPLLALLSYPLLVIPLGSLWVSVWAEPAELPAKPHPPSSAQAPHEASLSKQGRHSILQNVPWALHRRMWLGGQS